MKVESPRNYTSAAGDRLSGTDDVLVVGAGPGGCAAALAFAANGASVRVLDRQRPQKRGLAGEWLHPGGVTALGRLGVVLNGPGFLHNHGFIVHPGDGSPPIELPYPNGTAVSMPHSVLTQTLRNVLTTRPQVILEGPDRVLETFEDGTVRTTQRLLHANLVVGADGRASVVRRALRTDDAPSTVLSHTAGLLLPETTLPTEGYAHVILGAPGPVLAYRVAPNAIRVCLDVPRDHPAPPQVYHHLQQAYLPILPEPLRSACRTELAARRINWAANRFRRRTFYGHGNRVLVGDAVGHTHPLSALGMTMAILDGECLGRYGEPAAYARQRRQHSWPAERLSAAAHRALTDVDPASLAMRRALFTLWREHPNERDRMMNLLSAQDEHRRSLARQVYRIARTARGPLLELGSWLCWLAGPDTGVPPTPRQAGPEPSRPRPGRAAGGARQ
jgi:squalene monooxygenase